LKALRRYLEMVKEIEGPILLHVLTEKGHGFQPACEDPVQFHAPPPFARNEDNEIVDIKKSKSRAYTNEVADSIYKVLKQNENVAVMTAAMCAGNGLQKVRSDFPGRFFDVGICEAHAVAFAAGMAKAGAIPIVDIYSTFLQRSFDHIFQEVALQNLHVVFCLDRAGLCGPDGPTHHGVFDLSYLRVFPNMTVMAPGDEQDVAPMLDFAIGHGAPISMRYPKTKLEKVTRNETPIDLGKAEVFSFGQDGNFLSIGAMFPRCVVAAEKLRQQGLDVGVINARFVKPLDREVIVRALEQDRFLITVEENTLQGGFGSAVLEEVSAQGLSADRVHRIGVPDRFIEHGDREELLADLGMDVGGLVATAVSVSQQDESLVGE
jgi:1-deoxy-D-xylulose-5-phosphate synthase